MKISNCAARNIFMSLIITTVAAGTVTAGTQTGSNYRDLTRGYNVVVYTKIVETHPGMFGNISYIWGGSPGYTQVNHMRKPATCRHMHHMVGYSYANRNTDRTYLVNNTNNGWGWGLVNDTIDTTNNVVGAPLGFIGL